MLYYCIHSCIKFIYYTCITIYTCLHIYSYIYTYIYVYTGNIGTLEMLNSKVLSTQPIVSMDWSPDKEGLCVIGCLDQTIRCLIVTKLDKY